MRNTGDYIPGTNLPEIQQLLDEQSQGVSYRGLPGYGDRVVGIFRNGRQLPENPGLVSTSRTSPLSGEALSIKKDLDLILNPPVYDSPKERLLSQKQDRDDIVKLLTYILPQKIQAGALADNNMRLSGQSQEQTELFVRYFGNALKATLEQQFPGSQIPGSILQIYRAIVISSLDPTKSINWKQSLQEITISGSDQLYAREFIRRVSAIFEIFVENYVTTPRVQDTIQ